MSNIKGKFLFLAWCANLALIMLILCVLAILDLANFELANWVQDVLRSKIEIIAWLVVSTSCFFVFVILAANVFQKNKDIFMLRLGETKVVLMTNFKITSGSPFRSNCRYLT